MKRDIDRFISRIEKVIYAVLTILFGVMFVGQIFILHTDLTVTLLFTFMLVIGLWVCTRKED